MTQRKVQIVGWSALAVLCAVYAPMAMEYMLRFFTPNAPSLWETTFSSIVGDDIVFGPDSVYVDQHDSYVNSLMWLTIHTTLGGLAILLAIAQFSSKLRRTRPHIHRIIGRIYVPVVTVSMIGAIVYLVRTGADQTFSGPAFHAQLWGLVIGTLTTLYAAVFAIVRGQVRMHQACMALNFALLLSAPLLRMGYLTFGLTWPDTTHVEINLASAIVVSSALFFGAILAVQLPEARRMSAPSARVSTQAMKSALAIGFVSAIAVSFLYSNVVGGLNRLLLTFVATYIISLLAAFSLSRSMSNPSAKFEWRVATVCLLLAPVAFGALWAGYNFLWAVDQAFYAAALTSGAAALFVAYGVVVWTRRNPSRAIIKRSSDSPTAHV